MPEMNGGVSVSTLVGLAEKFAQTLFSLVRARRPCPVTYSVEPDLASVWAKPRDAQLVGCFLLLRASETADTIVRDFLTLLSCLFSENAGETEDSDDAVEVQREIVEELLEDVRQEHEFFCRQSFPRIRTETECTLMTKLRATVGQYVGRLESMYSALDGEISAEEALRRERGAVRDLCDMVELALREILFTQGEAKKQLRKPQRTCAFLVPRAD